MTVPEEAGGAGHVQPTLVQPKWFHLVGVAGVDLPGLGREVEVAVVVGRDADEAGTLLPGLPQHLAGADAKLFGHVVFSQYDPMAGFLIARHRHGLALERGVV